MARPACAPVNASDTPLRECPHDSGSSWVASPSMRGLFLRYVMPVYPGASSGRCWPQLFPPTPAARAYFITWSVTSVTTVSPVMGSAESERWVLWPSRRVMVALVEKLRSTGAAGVSAVSSAAVSPLAG